MSWLLESRLMLAWRLADRLNLFGGPTFGLHFGAPDDDARLGYGWSVREVVRPETRLRMWPGFVAGVRF